MSNRNLSESRDSLPPSHALAIFLAIFSASSEKKLANQVDQRIYSASKGKDRLTNQQPLGNISRLGPEELEAIQFLDFRIKESQQFEQNWEWFFQIPQGEDSVPVC